MGGQYSEQKDNEDIESKINSIKCDYLDYRSVVVHRYYSIEIEYLHNKYNITTLPTTVMSLISSYIPSLYQIYKMSKLKTDTISSSSSPTPSVSSVSSNYKKDHIERLYSWESMIYSTSNIYQCGSKYFIRAANKELYGIGDDSHVRLGCNISLMSCGLSAGNIAIKYSNGYIYTSKIGGKSFNKFASLFSINIIQIECGYNHSLFLSSDGKVYSMGINKYGECGIGDKELDSNQIAVINSFIVDKCFIISISCGYHHSCCVDGIKCKLYCFGDNTYHQCSEEKRNKIVIPKIYKYLRKINDNTNIIKAECGKQFTVCLTEKGYFYGFGRAKFILKSKNHKDDLMKNGVWFNTDRVLYRDFSVGLDHIVLITKYGEKILIFGYQFDNHLKVTTITDSLTQIHKNNFNALNKQAQIHKVIAGIHNSILIFKST